MAEGRGTNQDIEKARTLLEQTCKAGFPPACDLQKRLPPKE
jgi:TPR repeat protein